MWLFPFSSSEGGAALHVKQKPLSGELYCISQLQQCTGGLELLLTASCSSMQWAELLFSAAAVGGAAFSAAAVGGAAFLSCSSGWGCFSQLQQWVGLLFSAAAVGGAAFFSCSSAFLSCSSEWGCFSHDQSCFLMQLQ